MKKILSYIVVFLMVLGVQAQVDADIPEKPNPAHLVNDFAHVLPVSQVQELESELVQFARQTSTRIVVVTVDDLKGYDAGDFAVRLGQKWEVGQKGKDNGVVVLFKPKTADSRGQIYVAVGYGLEDVIPDVVANRIIVQTEMIPRFKQGDVFGGLYAGTKVIMDLASGKYTPQQYQEKVSSGGSGGIGLLVFLFIVFFVIIPIFRGRRGYYSASRRGSSLPFWLIMGSMMGSGNRGGSWSNFNSGGGGFGGGGFGGFGGGSFGGGGAGGSW